MEIIKSILNKIQELGLAAIDVYKFNEQDVLKTFQIHGDEHCE